MQIVAMGGGGFSMEDNLALDRYILEQTRTDAPSVCFLPTASGDADAYVTRFYQAFLELGARPSVLSLFRLPTADLAAYLAEQDVVYVGGGNTRSMLALWREWKLDSILRDAAQHGTILAGLSAGAACWFSESITDAVPGRLTKQVGLGFLEGAFCAHYGTEVRRRPTVHKWVRTGRLTACYGVDNGAALHFRDGQLIRAIRTRAGAGAYHVTPSEEGVAERPLDMEPLDRVPRRYR